MKNAPTRRSRRIKTPAAGTHIVRRPKRRRVSLIALIVLLPLLVGGYFLWRYFGTYESTDDAQIDGHIHAISARISGYVTQVLVEDQQQIVKVGDPPVIIDPRDFDVAVSKAGGGWSPTRKPRWRVRGTEVPITSTNTASTLQTAHSTLTDTQAGLLAAQRQFQAASIASAHKPSRVGD